MSDADELRREQEARQKVKDGVRLITEAAPYIWHWGDGEGGAVLEQLRAAIVGAGYPWPFDRSDRPVARQKDKISRKLSKAVFERDAYRCVTCDGHVDLCCDHIIPESKGGPTTLDNLQAMCRPCNSKKGNREA